MSTSSDNDAAARGDKVTLHVYTEDEAAEIFVIDGRFNLAGRGVGPHHEFALDPGIYKVKIMAGAEVCEEHVVLRPDEPPAEHRVKRLQFASPAPLEGTARTHEFHIAAAEKHSRRIHVNAGSGSWIFVCARGWTERVRTDVSTDKRPHPAAGLKLLDAEGETVVDFMKKSEKDLGWEPWAACNVSVDPGNYRLRLEVPSLGRTLEQTIVASPRWQTHVFLLQRDYARDARGGGEGGAGDVRADFAGASVLMSGPEDSSRPPGFNPAGNDLRQCELARLALLNQRKILSDELRLMLRHKFENPMLGIFSAHLLLIGIREHDAKLETKSSAEESERLRNKKKEDQELLGVVVKNLRKLVGREHPDVEALALAIGDKKVSPFDVPPMLQRSWSLICKATADRPQLVADDSLLAEVAEAWWSNSFWLTWLTPSDSEEESEAAEDAEDDEDDLDDLEEAILVRLKMAGRGRDRVRGASLRRPSTVGLDMRPLEVSADVTASADNRARSSAARADERARSYEDLSPTVERASSDDETIKRLTRQLGVPRATVEKTLDKLHLKMSSKKS